MRRKDNAHKIVCPVCDKGNLKEKRGEFRTDFMDGREKRELVLQDLSWQECNKCGERILDSESAKKIEEARYGALGLLTPLELKEMRKKLRMTQGQISQLLKVGNKTYCRWENGTLMQSKSMDTLIRLAIKDRLRILEKEKRVEMAKAYLVRLKERRKAEIEKEELKLAAHSDISARDVKKAGLEILKKMKTRN